VLDSVDPTAANSNTAVAVEEKSHVLAARLHQPVVVLFATLRDGVPSNPLAMVNAELSVPPVNALPPLGMSCIRSGIL